MIRARTLGLPVMALVTAACVGNAGPSGEVADIRGTWVYSGTQEAPALTLTGTLVIAQQTGDEISGQLSWEERDGLGQTRLDGGPVSGRVIARTDVDLDVFLPGGERRHVGHINVGADTIRGAWLQLAAGVSGAFVAVRGGP